MTNVLTISSIQKRIAVGVMAVAMFFGMALVAPSAHAQVASEDDLQGAIDNLMSQINGISGTLSSSDVARLKITTSSDNPDGTILEVDDNDESDEKQVFVVTIEEVNGIDVVVEEINMSVSASGDVNDIVDEVILYIDGDEVSSATPDVDGSLSFENIDYEIEGGEEIDIQVNVVFNGTENYSEGDQVTLTFEEVADATDENGYDEEEIEGLDPVDFDSDVFTLRSSGLLILADSDDHESSVSENNATDRSDDAAEFVIEIEVTAFGGDMYIPVGDYSNAPNTGFAYDIIDEDGAALGVSYLDIDTGTMSFTSTAERNAGQYIVEEGETESFTINIMVDPVERGYYRARLVGLRYYTDGAKQEDLIELDVSRQRIQTDFVFVDGTGVPRNGSNDPEDEQVDTDTRDRLQAEINRLMALVEALMQALAAQQGGGVETGTALCNDGIDNDNDGLMDMDDSGCASYIDDTEEDVVEDEDEDEEEIEDEEVDEEHQDEIDDLLDEVEDMEEEDDENTEEVDEELQDEIDDLLDQIEDTDDSEEEVSVTKFYIKAIDKVNLRLFYSDEAQTDLAYRRYAIKMKDGSNIVVKRKPGVSATQFTQMLRDVGYYGTLDNFKAKIVKLDPRVLGISISVDPIAQLGSAIDGFEAALAAFIK